MSFRSWLSIGTLIFVGVILFFSRHELIHAWNLLADVNVLVLLLVVPIAAVSYLAAGEMIFSYLRQKNLISEVSPWSLMRISLELNFVNHVLPSGGVSGVSYLNWRLLRLGVSSGKATMAQMVRYVAGFAAMTTLLIISVLVVTIDGNINRWIILMSSSLVSFMVVATLVGIYLLKSPSRMHIVAKKIERIGNRVMALLTLGKKKRFLNRVTILAFFDDMHDDYVSLNQDKRVLLQPYLWGLLFTIIEIMLFYVTFWALGSPVNPAPILIAYGVASTAGFIVVTPGGAGAYEAIMVLILAIAGLGQSEAIAGIILARVIILLVTIGLGYIFYQSALLKYGKSSNTHI